MSEAYDVVIVGEGIAGSALATVLARKGIAVAVLERDLAPAELRITARLAVTLRAEYGEEARLRRQRAGRRARIDKMLSPTPASIIGPEMLPAAAFEQSTIDALLAP